MLSPAEALFLAKPDNEPRSNQLWGLEAINGHRVENATEYDWFRGGPLLCRPNCQDSGGFNSQNLRKPSFPAVSVGQETLETRQKVANLPSSVCCRGFESV